MNNKTFEQYVKHFRVGSSLTGCHFTSSQWEQLFDIIYDKWCSVIDETEKEYCESYFHILCSKINPSSSLFVNQQKYYTMSLANYHLTKSKVKLE